MWAVEETWTVSQLHKVPGLEGTHTALKLLSCHPLEILIILKNGTAFAFCMGPHGF